MDFAYSPKVRELEARLRAFMEEHVYPNEARFHEEVDAGDRWQPTRLVEELKERARAAGLWNLFLPASPRGADLDALGIPSESQYLDRYLQRTGRARPSAADWEFYVVFNMFRAAAIFQGVMARAVAGNAASAQALETGKRARPTAEFAWKQVERLLAG